MLDCSRRLSVRVLSCSYLNRVISWRRCACLASPMLLLLLLITALYLLSLSQSVESALLPRGLIFCRVMSVVAPR